MSGFRAVSSHRAGQCRCASRLRRMCVAIVAICSERDERRPRWHYTPTTSSPAPHIRDPQSTFSIYTIAWRFARRQTSTGKYCIDDDASTHCGWARGRTQNFRLEGGPSCRRPVKGDRFKTPKPPIDVPPGLFWILVSYPTLCQKCLYRLLYTTTTEAAYRSIDKSVYTASCENRDNELHSRDNQVANDQCKIE